MNRRLLFSIVGLAFVPVVVSLAAIAAPRVLVPPWLADVVAFGGATGTCLIALVLLSHGELPKPARLAVGIAAPVTVFAIALAGGARPLHAITIAACLTAFGHVLGDFIGANIEHPGHLMPACVVASAADIVSVLHPSGPSHAVIASERALSWMAVSFPVLGTPHLAPALGVGDLLFIALLLATVRRHNLPSARAALLVAAGIAVAGAASYSLEAPIPALPAIGLVFLLGMPASRKLRPKDRTIAAVSMIGAVVVAGSLLASRFLLPTAP